MSNATQKTFFFFHSDGLYIRGLLHGEINYSAAAQGLGGATKRWNRFDNVSRLSMRLFVLD
jgi:hypothetical protein